MELSGHLHTVVHLPLEEIASDVQCIVGWVDPRTGLDMVANKKAPAYACNQERTV
jgi:hypothetical protein